MNYEYTEREYWNDVRLYAEEAQERAKDEDAEVSDVLHEIVDGSSWVIYTYANKRVLDYSPNEDAYAEDFGTDGMVKGGGINWAGLAYAALYRDVSDVLCEAGAL